MRTFLFTLFLCTQLTAFAQTEITRTVVDTQGQLMPGAIVTCLDNQEELLRGTVTDESGTFSIRVDFTAQEWLRVSFLGYEDQDYHSLAALPDTIVLEERAEELGEVVVQGKSIVTQKTDRLIFHIANENLTKGNSTFQLLSFTPLIKVDNDNIEIIGKNGMQLYVNDRKSLLSGEALRAYLKSLPAENIESIEIITAPGSESRTGENEGIINLILKKDESVGWKGSLSLYDAQGIHNSPEVNLYLDYQKNKDAVSIAAYVTKHKERYNKESQYDYLNSGVTNRLEEITRLKHWFYGANAGWDHRLNDKQVFGLRADVSYAQKYNDIYGTTRIQNTDASAADSIVYMPNFSDNRRFQASGNVNYRLTTDEQGSKLELDADFVRTVDDNDVDLLYSHVEDGVTGSPYLQQQQNTNNSYSTWSGSAAYNHVFSAAHQLKVGAEFYSVNGNNDFFHGDLEGNTYVRDPLLSNNLDMTENYGGVYVSSQNRWSDQFSTNIGVRAEYVKRKGVKEEKGQAIKDNDFAALPSVSLNYAPNASHSLSASFNLNRIRPSLTLLFPARYYLSPTVYRDNNPDLDPIYSYISSLQYILKQHYIFSVIYIGSPMMNSFRRTVDGEYTQIVTETFGRQHAGILTFSWNDSFFENSLSVNAYCSGAWNRAYGSFEDLHVDMNKFTVNTSLMANYAVPFVSQMNVAASGSYSTPHEEPGMKSNGNYAFSFWIQKIFKHDISLKAGVDHLVYNKGERTYTGADYHGVENTDYHFRQFYVQLTIPFGRKKVSGAEWHSGSAWRGKSRLQQAN